MAKAQELSTLERLFHGCLIVSTETGRGIQYEDSPDGRKLVSDGWDHVVKKDGAAIHRSPFGTLAAAIAAAKATRPPEDVDSDDDFDSDDATDLDGDE